MGGATVISHGRHLPIGHAGDDEGYLHAIIDCCTPELGGWSLELRCRDDEAIACVEAAVLARSIQPGQPTLGTDIQTRYAFGLRIVRPAMRGSGVTGAYPLPFCDRLERVRLLAR